MYVSESPLDRRFHANDIEADRLALVGGVSISPPAQSMDGDELQPLAEPAPVVQNMFERRTDIHEVAHVCGLGPLHPPAQETRSARS